MIHGHHVAGAKDGAELRAALGRAQRQHDLFLSMTYQRGMRDHANLDAIARDPETLYHIEATEAITAYLEQQ
jgi:hypothetical protein